MSRSEHHNAAVEAAELYKLQVENLQETLDELREEMVREKAHMVQEMTGMEEILAHFITRLENSGRTLEQLGPRQAKRKLGEFRNRAQVALFFAHSIGLNPHSLEVSTTSGKAVLLPLSPPYQLHPVIRRRCWRSFTCWMSSGLVIHSTTNLAQESPPHHGRTK